MASSTSTTGCVLGVVGDVSVVVIMAPKPQQRPPPPEPVSELRPRRPSSGGHAVIGICSVLIRQLATPFQRGFFQDDESLMHPFKQSTIKASVLYGVGFLLPTVAIVLVEGGRILRKQHQGKAGSCADTKGSLKRQWLWHVYRAGLMFYFGVVVTHISTNIPKYTIGRLRPHFFAVCVPDWSRVNGSGYIEDDICTGSNRALITEARLACTTAWLPLVKTTTDMGDMPQMQATQQQSIKIFVEWLCVVSFPSGHSSMAVYCMLFLVLYLQRRFTWQGMTLLRPFLQAVLLLMSLYTCLSRISDYKHHWSDVLAGGLLGALVALLVFWSLRDSLLLKPTRGNGVDQGFLEPATELNSCGSANPVTPTTLSTTF